MSPKTTQIFPREVVRASNPRTRPKFLCEPEPASTTHRHRFRLSEDSVAPMTLESRPYAFQATNMYHPPVKNPSGDVG
ncbi:hypothetical protein GALMADRAFT_229659 [Galerina marginata CBS 339.88]|uniref:Uncharacterized protein n=1 Tax=Galerina marginata (strain CBS 339.88) TaxID=685588 RepID=A0A067SK46_GALM3|nr:hypothetical protein GALMADRAFT_229659 [Galerina marginata CBS 339.88]